MNMRGATPIRKDQKSVKIHWVSKYGEKEEDEQEKNINTLYG